MILSCLVAHLNHNRYTVITHDDVIKWKHIPHYWPIVRIIHRLQVNSPHKGQLRGALMGFFICAWINVWVNNRKAGVLRRNRAHYDLTVMIFIKIAVYIMKYAHFFAIYGCVILYTFLEFCNSLCKMIYVIKATDVFFLIRKRLPLYRKKKPHRWQTLCICKV